MRPSPVIHLSEDQKRIVWRLRTGGPASRTELARELGIHNGALTRLSRELVALGVVEEQNQNERAARGRPTVPLTVSDRAGYAAGATVHPGWLEISLVDFAGEVVARDIEPMESDDPAIFAEAVERRLRGLAVNHNMLRSRFLGLGVGIPGPAIVGRPNHWWAVEWLKGWRDLDLVAFLTDRLGLPVWLQNDSSAAALAEYYTGNLLKVCDSALALFIGHGVGGGVIAGREMFVGEYGNAGEVGRLYPGGRPRPSGIDLLASLRAAGAEVTSLLDVEGCLRTHPEVISAWIDRAARQLELVVNAGIVWMDPGAVVISGALPLSILEGLASHLESSTRLFMTPDEPPHLAPPLVKASTLGSSAVSIGAALLPIHEIGRPGAS